MTRTRTRRVGCWQDQCDQCSVSWSDDDWVPPCWSMTTTFPYLVRVFVVAIAGVEVEGVVMVEGRDGMCMRQLILTATATAQKYRKQSDAVPQKNKM